MKQRNMSKPPGEMHMSNMVVIAQIILRSPKGAK